jgi:hypothetical protein
LTSESFLRSSVVNAVVRCTTSIERSNETGEDAKAAYTRIKALDESPSHSPWRLIDVVFDYPADWADVEFLEINDPPRLLARSPEGAVLQLSWMAGSLPLG